MARMMIAYGRFFNYPYCFLTNAATGDLLAVKTSEEDYKPLWDALYSKFTILIVEDADISPAVTSMGELPCAAFEKCKVLDADDIIGKLMK